MSLETIALVPAAGFATRLGALPRSKELLPAGWQRGQAVGPTDKPLTGHLFDRLARGGIRRALVVTREEKRDIPERLGDGAEWGLEIEVLDIGPTASTVETLDAAYDRVRGAQVALGYPDIVFRPTDAYRHVARARARLDADVALGLFPSDQPEKSDMVDLAPDGEVRRLVIKQRDRGLPYTWSIAVWTPRFTDYLHDFAADRSAGSRELYVGDVIQSALDDGLSVVAHPFEDGASTDLGTPEALAHPPRWVFDAL